jgi:hypothetical protein
MVAYNFKKQFADDVESGKKLQTIRQKCRAKQGDKLQLYTGMRSPGCRKLRDAYCVAVDAVSITPDGPFFGQPGWWPKDKNVFAERDGFQTYADMYQWFKTEYDLDDDDDFIFNGYVTMWSAP